MALAMGRKSRNGVHAAWPPGGSGGGSKWQVWQDFGIPKSRLSSLKSGGREGIRTPGLLVANSGENKLRQGATITYHGAPNWQTWQTGLLAFFFILSASWV